MKYICYETTKFGAAALDKIEKADALIHEYSRMGYTLTLRQLYYQFVARGWIENTERSYKNLGGLVTKGRMAGLLPWDDIEDRAREFNRWTIEEDPVSALNNIEYRLAYDLWERQGIYIEAWVEKEALGNVLERAARRWKLPYMACKGYLSASQAWRAGERFKDAYVKGARCILLHLGDHDPSGIDMTRDNDDRIRMLSDQAEVDVRRLALNIEQVHEFNPPPNPAKLTDSRVAGYLDRFGESSWELDALRPEVIEGLINQEVESIIDADLWDDTMREQKEARANLAALRENYTDIIDWLNKE